MSLALSKEYETAAIETQSSRCLNAFANKGQFSPPPNDDRDYLTGIMRLA